MGISVAAPLPLPGLGGGALSLQLQAGCSGSARGFRGFFNVGHPRPRLPPRTDAGARERGRLLFILSVPRGAEPPVGGCVLVSGDVRRGCWGTSTWPLPHLGAVRNAAVQHQHRVPPRAAAPGGFAPSPSRGAAASRLCFALAPSTRLTGPHLATGCRISPSSPSSSPCSSCWEMPFPHRVVAALVSPVHYVPNQGRGGL